jgi:hypothetical protein
MANVLLVSEGKLKAFTNINKNLDIDAIRAELSVAQDLHLQPLLGTKFYKHLLAQVYPTGNTFNADELELVNEYIAPFLINVSYFEMIPHLHYRTMNRGIVEGQMESATSVDAETMKYLRGIQKQRSEFYKQRLQDYLITGEGQNKFPDYLNYSTINGMIPDKSSKYNSPIVLNHTTRYGYSKRGYPGRGGFGNLPSYSEIESSNPSCYDCY